ncbi:MAG: succinate dehydrogenase assembly factor 2 [Gammaproteobacteria bacterium]|nr:succinate dehydrogenase assembly factor 2 [Pseudomonadales bacterium]MCP5346449.1 succinate dehydrogenase assembly factor 2 [Pseudomonadales bacterium]
MESINKNRILWHSRRGMLELDLLLEPFARQRFETLSAGEQQLYQRLLSCEDQDLYAWLLQRGDPDDASLKPIIESILAFSRHRD